jgi:hypothetical protein
MGWKLLLVFAALPACAVGKNEVLFVTKTGLALDADTTPPALDLGYMRKEGVLAPIFEDDEVLPVLTTVGVKTKGLGLSANHSFATGDAATIMADALLRSTRYDPVREGMEAPRKSGRIHVPKGSARKRYFFGTDTAIGLHAEWTSAAVPTAVTIGWKRKELAYVPLMETTVYVDPATKRVYASPPRGEASFLVEGSLYAERGDVPDTPPGTRKSAKTIKDLVDAKALVAVSSVRLASLIATAYGGGQASTQEETGISVGQTFATGVAATLLATHPEIRRVLGPSLLPDGRRVAQLALSPDRANYALLNTIYDHLPDPSVVKRNLDSLPADIGVGTLTVYAFSSTPATLTVRDLGPFAAFDEFVSALSQMSSSVEHVRRARADTSASMQLAGSRSGTLAGSSLAALKDDELKRVEETYEGRVGDLAQDVSRHPAAIAAVECFIEQLRK